MSTKIAFMFSLAIAAANARLSLSGRAKENGDAQAELAALVAKLTAKHISRIEIIYMPERVLTRTRVTPDMLERQFYYKLVMREASFGALTDELTKQLSAISVQSSKDSADLRWGIIFYASDDARVVGLFFDPSGRHGTVNKLLVSFNGEFLRWLRATFAGCFRG